MMTNPITISRDLANAGLDKEIADVKSEIADFKIELKAEIADLRGEIKPLALMGKLTFGLVVILFGYILTQ